MSRVFVVEKNRKPQRCSRCGAEILPGAGYRHTTPGFRGQKIVRCMAPACAFKPSDLTTSKMSQVYAAVETAEAVINDWDGLDKEDLVSALQDCAEEVRNVAQEYADAADSLGGAGEAMQEKADSLESWADDIESAADDIPDRPGEDEDEDEEDAAADEEELTSWVEEARSAALAPLGDCPE